ncbi:MAG TPA: hypothetical protein VK202_07295, partial [Bacteroidia bacterium]|nr:hypothetical protein [Bacteroidia bacterium]
LYVFIGIAIALGAVVLYSFKAKENAEVSYAIIKGNDLNSKINIYYDDGLEEDVKILFGVKIGDNRDNGKLLFHNAISKTLKHMSQKGYKVVGYSASNNGNTSYTFHHYTLIKEN